jgi:hypothetical protein
MNEALAVTGLVPRVRDALRLDTGDPVVVLVGSGVCDMFVSTGYRQLQLDESLWQPLRAAGYRLILFSSQDDPVYFFDEQSRYLFQAATGRGPDRRRTRHGDPGVTSRRASPAGAAITQNVPMPNAGAAAPSDDAPMSTTTQMRAASPVPGTGPHRASARGRGAVAARAINAAMRMPGDTPTAVVIARAEDFLQLAGAAQELGKWFAEWQQDSATMGNICVLAFTTSQSWEAAVEYVRSLGCLNALVSYLEQQGTRAHGRAVGEIGEPDAGEIERIIHIERIQHKLRIADWRELDWIVAALASQRGVLAGNLMRRLRRLALSGTELSGQMLRERGWVAALPGGQPAWDRLCELTGLAEVKEHINRLRWQAEAEARRRRRGVLRERGSLHLVFTGRPGTGKTTVARLIGELYRERGLLRRGHLHAPEASELIGMYVGHTAVQTNRAIDAALDGVLFIDEAYRLSEQPGGFGQEAIDTLVTRMDNDRDRLVVIVAGYPDKMAAFLRSNPGLPRRFPRGNIIEFPDYEPDALFAILLSMLRARDLTWVPELEPLLRRVVAGLYAMRDETFGNAGEMRNLAQELDANWARRVKAVITEPVTSEDLPTAYQRYL